MKNCRLTMFIVIVVGFLATLAIWERMQVVIIGYKTAAAEKKISRLKEAVRQNEINLDYLKSKQLLLSRASSVRMDVVQPKNVQIVRKDDNTRTTALTMNQAQPSNDRRRQ